MLKAPAAFACPTMVELPELYSLMVPSPLNIMYLNETDPVPDGRVIRMLVVVGEITVKGSISIGSPPRLLRLKPNKVEPLSSVR
ncbi:hypothetical protein D3C86_1405790 [compost metagenome]